MSKLQFHAGMTVPERIALREQIEAEYTARARREASQVHRSLACREANLTAAGSAGGWTEDQIRAMHAQCKAEAMGGGCLDECHDEALAAAQSGDS